MWKVNGRQTKDAKWWQKLTLPLARWAKKNLISTLVNHIHTEQVGFFFTKQCQKQGDCYELSPSSCTCYSNLGKDPFRNKIAKFDNGSSITHKDDHFVKNCIKLGFKIFSICCPLSANFILETIRDRGFCQHTTKSSQSNQSKEKKMNAN